MCPYGRSFSSSGCGWGGGAGEGVNVAISANMLNLTLSDGVQKPINGNYTLLLSRGQGVGEEVSLRPSHE